MKPNLEHLKDEIVEHLKTQGFVVFHGYSRHGDSRPVAIWDTHGHPEFQDFLGAARQAGAKVVSFNRMEFVPEMLDDAKDRLEDCELPDADRRRVERRLREMRGYVGFTCDLQLCFDCEGRTYIYELQAEWYTEFLLLLGEIDSYLIEDDDEEDEDEDSAGGYFTRN